MIKTKFFITFLLFTLSIHSQTLDEYILYALENTPELKESYKEFEILMQKIEQEGSLNDPNFSFGYFISPVETRVGAQNMKFSISQMFPWFGTIEAKKNKNKFLAEAQFYRFLNVKNKIIFNVKKVYYSLFENQKNIYWNIEMLKVLNTYKKIVLSNISNSKGNTVDFMRITIMIDDLLNKISILNENTRTLEVEFNSILNKELKNPVFIQETLWSDDERFDFSAIEEINKTDTVYKIKENNELKSIDFMLLANQEAQTIAKKKSLPNIGLGINYIVVQDRPNITITDNGKDILMPTMTISLPIYRNKNNSSQKIVALNDEKLQFSKQKTLNNLQNEYEKIIFMLHNAKRNFELYQKQIQHTQKAINTLNLLYSTSGKDLRDILDFEQKVLEYKIKQTSSIKEYLISLSKLDYITSKYKENETNK